MWTDALQYGSPVDVIFLILRRPLILYPMFDSLVKFEVYGILGKVLDWISSFLKNHKQRVIISGVTSSWTGVMSEVPQGSVLGSLLFRTFVNDLPFIFQNSCLLFADDLKIYSAVRNDDDALSLQNDLNKLISWTNIWQQQHIN